jgi:hypothetical protein
LLTAAYVNLAWAGFTEMQQAIGAAISFVSVVGGNALGMTGLPVLMEAVPPAGGRKK